MKIHCLCPIGIILLLLVGCGTKHDSTVDTENVASEHAGPLDVTSNSVETGIYLVNRWTIENGALDPLFEDEIYFEYREDKYQELQEDEPEPAKHVALSRTEFIPMDLESAPKRLDGDGGRAEVSLTFSKAMTEKLTKFSRKYLGRQIALVINGDIITMHKIRSVLTGNGLQISRCTDDGCELILAKLKEYLTDST